MQELGLQSSYTHDLGTRSFIKKMMALPFLPEEEIEPMFQRLQRHASEPLQQFPEYVKNKKTIPGSTARGDPLTVPHSRKPSAPTVMLKAGTVASTAELLDVDSSQCIC